MSNPQNKIRQKLALARMEIVAQLYKRGYSFRKIQEEVVARLNLETYSLSTVKKDVDKLLAELKERRIANMEEARDIAISKIDDRNRELWDQWEKSKTNTQKKVEKRKGAPGKEDPNQIKTLQVEKTDTEIIALGDVAYMTEIRNNEAERNKLLGLYAAEERDVTVTSFDLNSLTEEQQKLLLNIGEKALGDNEN